MVQVVAPSRSAAHAPSAPAASAAGAGPDGSDAHLVEPRGGQFARLDVRLPAPPGATLAEIERKVYARERLSAEDGLALYACADLLWLGRLARFAQRRVSGDDVYFNVN